jgi:hypothetical protein
MRRPAADPGAIAHLVARRLGFLSPAGRRWREPRRPARARPVLLSTAMRAPVLSSALLLAACGGGGTDPDALPLVDAGPSDFRPDRVGFINLVEGGGFLSIYAAINDGPDLPALELAERFGECAVYVRPLPSHCEPACAGVCTAPDTCAPYPAAVDVGDITVSGLHAPLVFVHGPFGYTPDERPGADVFADDASIDVTAPGASAPGFTAHLRGVPALVAPSQNLTLVDGQDAEVTWTGLGAARIQLQLVVGWHGTLPEAIMVCETDDDGAFTIPGDAIAALPRQSSSLESHTSFLVRFERAVVTSPAGPIEIVVGAQSTLFFSHP